MSVAYDLQNGGSGQYTYHSDMFYPENGLNQVRLDWRYPIGESEREHNWSGGPAFGKILYFVSHNPFTRIRYRNIEHMNTVLVTRSIYEILESKFVKLSNSKKHPHIKIEDESSFFWDVEINRIVEFFNTWGYVKDKNPNLLHFRYDDLKKDPQSSFEAIAKLWGLDISSDNIATGISRSDKKSMIQAVNATDDDPEIRSSNRETRDILSNDIKNHVYRRLKKELIYDFGHGISPDESEYVNYG